MTTVIPVTALEHHIGILGKTGSGKSNLAKTIAEDLLESGERVCVIDPTGTWWGLRLNAAGGASGHSVVILGGEYADVPIAANHGAAVANAIGTTSTSAVIDTRQFTVSDRTRFFTAFAEALIRDNRGNLTVIIDEAHLFMPQGGARVGGGAPAMLHAGNNLVSLGRGVGLRIVLITQRPAKLHKDSLTQVETLVAMRLIAPQDTKAVKEWIGEWADHHDSKDLLTSLPSLPTGDAWVWSPEIGFLERVHCPLAATFDSGHVRHDENAPALPSIDIDEITARLAPPEKPAAKADGKPAELRRRIVELERERKRLNGELAAAVRRIAEEKAVARGEARDLFRECMAYLDQGAKLAAKVAAFLTDNDPEPAPAPERPERKRKVAPTPYVDRDVTKPQGRILDALAWLAAMGIADSASRVQVAFMAGYKPNGGAFNNNLGALRSQGLIEYPTNGEVRLTEAGETMATTPDVPMTQQAFQDAVMERLSGPQKRVLQPLIDAFPSSLSTAELALHADYEAAGGAFNNTRGSLRSLGLIEYPDRGTARAVAVLFP